MNICVFDTETIGLEKSFCYNIGLTIYDSETLETMVKEDFVVEQIWNNKELFETAYYANKKDIYISRMKARQTFMKKYGYITQHIKHLFELYEVAYAYAYNSPFDVGVFDFNCNWFKCLNPFDNTKVIDIRGLVHRFIAFTPEFQQFCEKNERFTESFNYSTTAETLYRYLFDINFEEEHTALADSLIEAKILQKCIELGGEYGEDYKVYRSIPRKVSKTLHLVFPKDTTMNKTFMYNKIKINKNPKDTIVTVE